MARRNMDLWHREIVQNIRKLMLPSVRTSGLREVNSINLVELFA